MTRRVCPKCGMKTAAWSVPQRCWLCINGACDFRCAEGKFPKGEAENMSMGGDLMADAEAEILRIREKMGRGAFENFVLSLLPSVFPPLPGHPEFHRILDEMRALHAKKAADYGLGKDVLANCRSSEEFGVSSWLGVAIRMNDKMTRIKSLAQKGTVSNEPIEDSFLDLACYAIIGLILYRERQAAIKELEAKEAQE